MLQKVNLSYLFQLFSVPTTPMPGLLTLMCVPKSISIQFLFDIDKCRVRDERGVSGVQGEPEEVTLYTVHPKHVSWNTKAMKHTAETRNLMQCKCLVPADMLCVPPFYPPSTLPTINHMYIGQCVALVGAQWVLHTMAVRWEEVTMIRVWLSRVITLYYGFQRIRMGG